MACLLYNANKEITPESHLIYNAKLLGKIAEEIELVNTRIKIHFTMFHNDTLEQELCERKKSLYTLKEEVKAAIVDERKYERTYDAAKQDAVHQLMLLLANLRDDLQKKKHNEDKLRLYISATKLNLERAYQELYWPWNSELVA